MRTEEKKPRAVHRGQRRKERPGDHRTTPREVWSVALRAARIKEWDLDVATNEHSTVPCRKGYSLARGDDGLEDPWHGDVWCNPPFSKILPWVARAVLDADPARSITLLAPCSLDTTWAQYATHECDAWCAWRYRPHFPIPGQPKGSPPAGIALWYWGPGSRRWIEVMRGEGHLAWPGGQ